MEITHLGLSSFKIRGKNATIITDPYDPDMVGLKFPPLEADIVTISHDHNDHNHLERIGGNPLVINGPGEYEVKGAEIIGIASFHDNEKGKLRGPNTLYRINLDDVSLVHLGDLGHELNDHDIEALDGIDILLIPVGGFFTISASEAVAVISKLEPSIIIPMHYLTEKMNLENFGKIAPVAAFLKEMGKEGIIPQPKLNISKDKIPAEPTIVVLE